MASRNRTASWIHYPFAQPAAVPLAEGDKQQVVWFFRLNAAAAVVVATPFMPLALNDDTMALALAQAGIIPLTVRQWGSGTLVWRSRGMGGIDVQD
jgi:hypothetical protein